MGMRIAARILTARGERIDQRLLDALAEAGEIRTVLGGNAAPTLAGSRERQQSAAGAREPTAVAQEA